MKKSFEFSKILTGRPDAAWATLSRIDGVEKWFPMVSTCEVDRSGDTPRRFCQLADGTAIEESVPEIDHRTRTLRYTVDQGLPVQSYGGVFSVRSRPDGQDELYWRVDVEADPDVMGQIENLLDQAAEAALNGLDEASRHAA